MLLVVQVLPRAVVHCPATLVCLSRAMEGHNPFLASNEMKSQHYIFQVLNLCLVL